MVVETVVKEVNIGVRDNIKGLEKSMNELNDFINEYESNPKRTIKLLGQLLEVDERAYDYLKYSLGVCKLSADYINDKDNHGDIPKRLRKASDIISSTRVEIVGLLTRINYTISGNLKDDDVEDYGLDEEDLDHFRHIKAEIEKYIQRIVISTDLYIEKYAMLKRRGLVE